jgi:hypothetical protein
METNTVIRIWHGWTTPANADVYEDLLLDEVIVGIQDRHIPGFNDIRHAKHWHASTSVRSITS